MENLVMSPCRELRASGRRSLSGKWLVAIGIMLIYGIMLAVSMFTFVGSFIIAGALLLGMSTFYIKLSRGKDGHIEDLFSGFNNFINAFVAYLLQGLFTFFWSMLFIIPGIIKAYSYAMTYYILCDNPKMGANEAITKSRAMMDGYKFKYFLLELSFFGWFLLCVITFGLALLYVTPYMHAANAAFYKELKAIKYPEESRADEEQDNAEKNPVQKSADTFKDAPQQPLGMSDFDIVTPAPKANPFAAEAEPTRNPFFEAKKTLEENQGDHLSDSTKELMDKYEAMKQSAQDEKNKKN